MKKQKVSILPMLLFCIRMLLCGVGIGWASVQLREIGSLRLGLFLWILILMICMILENLLQTYAHEGGHWLFGLLSGYRFCSFRVGKHMWLRKNGKLCRKQYELAGSGGQCIMEPPAMQNGTFPYVAYNMGGVYMNAIVGALSMIGCLLLAARPFPAVLLYMNALIGFQQALTNGVPGKAGLIQNDGSNTRDLKGNAEAIRALWIQLKLSGETTRGVHLKDLPEEWFHVPEEALDNMLVASVAVYNCNRLMNAQKIEEAEQTIAELLAKDTGMVDLHRNLLICDRIYCLLVLGRPKEAWEPLYTDALKKVLGAMASQLCVLRTQYAIAALGERDIEKAEKIEAEFHKQCAVYPYDWEIESETGLLQIAKQKTDAARETV